MNLSAMVQLVVATAIFIGAASSAKTWALAPSAARAILTLSLYMLGNILMMRLLRGVGMATAFSMTSVLQLVAVNLVAILVFRERLSLQEGIGIVFALLGVALISFAPRAVP